MCSRSVSAYVHAQSLGGLCILVMKKRKEEARDVYGSASQHSQTKIDRLREPFTHIYIHTETSNTPEHGYLCTTTATTKHLFSCMHTSFHWFSNWIHHSLTISFTFFSDCCSCGLGDSLRPLKSARQKITHLKTPSSVIQNSWQCVTRYTTLTNLLRTDSYCVITTSDLFYFTSWQLLSEHKGWIEWLGSLGKFQKNCSSV